MAAARRRKDARSMRLRCSTCGSCSATCPAGAIC
ncbi:hypothetical protein [Noviherbaspirillum album]